MNDSKTCPHCGATWINGQHYWSGTGQKGDEKTLINPMHKTGHIYGEADTWEKRAKFIDSVMKPEG